MAKQQLGPLQTEWVRCLKSGEWEQGSGLLCQDVGTAYLYCCLGVACEVAMANGLALKETGNTAIAFDNFLYSLPVGVRGMMRFRTEAGQLKHTPSSRRSKFGSRFETLAGANDGHASFAEIAAFAERFPEVVFEMEA